MTERVIMPVGLWSVFLLLVVRKALALFGFCVR